MNLNLHQVAWVAKLADLKLHPSTSMAQWLTKPYILNKTLEQAHGSIQVQVLYQGFNEAFEHEHELLKNEKRDRPFFVREVYLKQDEKILTYGRVVMPEVTYLNNKTKILELKNKPFGKHILYSHPNYTRSEFEYAYIQYNEHPLWGRRSLFYLNADPLIVTEFYMTELGPYPKE